MLFTNTDKSLLLRAARLLLEDATKLESTHGSNWVASKESKAAKAEYDRLHRDARDIKKLVKRLEAETGKLVAKPGLVAELQSGENHA